MPNGRGVACLQTVGYGDIVAKTNTEMVFSFTMEILGVMVFGTLSGMLSSMVLRTPGARQAYETQMDFIRGYCEAVELDVATRRKVIAFYDNLWVGKARAHGLTPPHPLRFCLLCVAVEYFGTAWHTKTTKRFLQWQVVFDENQIINRLPYCLRSASSL